MKRLNETPRQSLVKMLTDYVYSKVENLMLTEENICNDVNKILSKYDVKDCEYTFIIPEVPNCLIAGNKVVVTYAPTTTKQVFHGEVIKVFYRDIYYSYNDITPILEHPDIREEQRDMIRLSLREEPEKRIYHTLVLDSEEKGIILIPLLLGVYIEQE